MMQLPAKVPEVGFYYHYKHDPNGSVENYAYEFLSVEFDTENDGVWKVNYRPLYQSARVYQASLALGVPCTDGRPLEMWMEYVEKDGKTIPRFKKITDSKTIVKLRKIRNKMYGKAGMSKEEMATTLLEDLGLNFPQLFSESQLHIRNDDGELRDDDTRGRLYVSVSRDGDLWIGNNRRNAASRFSPIGIGGGGSPRTRNALLLLALAMKLDNED